MVVSTGVRDPASPSQSSVHLSWQSWPGRVSHSARATRHEASETLVIRQGRLQCFVLKLCIAQTVDMTSRSAESKRTWVGEPPVLLLAVWNAHLSLEDQGTWPGALVIEGGG